MSLGIDLEMAINHGAKKRSWQAIILIVAMALFAGIGAQYLYLNGSYKVFFEKTDPLLIEFENMEKSFARDDSIVIVAVPKDGNVFSIDALTQIQEITDQAWQVPYSTRVDSLTNYQHTIVEEDDLIVDNLIPDDSLIDDEMVSSVKSVALSEPTIRNKLVSTDGKVSVININIHLPENEDPNITTKNAALYAKKMTDAVAAKYETMDYYHTGIIPLNYALTAEAEKDAATLIPLMFVVILVLLAVTLRTAVGTMLTLSIVVLTIVSTMGIAGWFGYFISASTVHTPTIILSIVIADCVHMIASVQFARRQGMSKNAAIFDAMRLNAKPIFITSATTAIGFLTLKLSDSPPLVDFGELSALGIMIACFLSLTLLPALLVVVPFKISRESKNSTMLTKIGGVVTKNYKVILPVSIAVIAFFAYLVPKNVVNDDVVKYFSERTEFRIASDKQEEFISGLTVLNFIVDTDVKGAVYEPELMNFIDSFRAWLLEQDEVTHVTALSDTVKRLNKNLNQDNQAEYRIPEDREMLSQSLLLYELSLPYGLGLNNLVNMDKSATRLAVSTWNLGSNEYLDLEARGLQWVENTYPEMSGKVSMTGATIMFARVGQENMHSMLKSLALALFLISLLLCFALSSFRLGAISLIPNIAPAVIGFGAWYLLSGEIDMTLSIVASMSLGLVVDDAVHFLTKYSAARKKGMGCEEAIKYTFGSVGVALFTTTLVLAVGFSVLAMSAFNINANMGMLTALIITIALIVDMTFLPAFLMLVDQKQERYSDDSEAETVNQVRETNEAIVTTDIDTVIADVIAPVPEGAEA